MSVMRILACLILASVSGFSFAAGGTGACRADAQKFCPQTKGGEQVMDCLLDHQQDISDACYDRLKARLEAKRGFQACKQDAEKFCQGVQQGGGRIIRCLMDHQQDISDDCYNMMAKKRSGASH